MVKRSARSIGDIEEQIKKLKEQIRRKQESQAKRFAKIAEQAGLLEREISDEELLREFQALAERFPQKT